MIGDAEFARRRRHDFLQKILCLLIIINIAALAPVLLFLYNDSFLILVHGCKLTCGITLLIFITFLAICAILLKFKQNWFYYPKNLPIIVTIMALYAAALTVTAAYYNTDLVIIFITHLLGVCAIVFVFCFQIKYDLFPCAGWFITICGVLIMYGFQCFVFNDKSYKTNQLVSTAIVSFFLVMFLIIDVYFITTDTHVYYVPYEETGLAVLILFCDIITGFIFIPYIFVRSAK